MRLYIISFIAIVLIASCGRIPEPIGYSHTKQNQMQASHHWDVLAADVADQINNELILKDYLNTPVYVRETCGSENKPCDPNQTTVFDESFRDLLITRLVALGVPTSPQPSNNSITINFKAQTVYHHRTRVRTVEPGLLTALTAGILVLRNAPTDIVILALAGVLDFVNAGYASSSHHEIIITTSMIAEKDYIYRSSNIYYINDMDSWHYQQINEPTEISMTGGAPPPPVPSRKSQQESQSTTELPNPIIPDHDSNSTGI
ncbi:MAG: hypothetical protein D6B25_18735 [Desulfobulbaceae bacterium]|nr:MAG: hypothetical protein D6B25_18735 [Desulfobulbaceae bacterium]